MAAISVGYLPLPRQTRTGAVFIGGHQQIVESDGETLELCHEGTCSCH
jgi:hypothetical protein